MTEKERRGGEAMASVDPVCGARVAADGAASATLRHAGRTWRFCGPICRDHFARQAARDVLAEALRAGRLFSHRGRARWGVA